MRLILILLITVFLTTVSARATSNLPSLKNHKTLKVANVDDCEDAIQEYKSVLDDVLSHLNFYTMCINSADGTDDCSTEFLNLQSSQSDFEDAVSDYQTNCS